MLAVTREANELLRTLGTDRNDEPPAFSELREQGVRHRQRRGRYQDAVERLLRLPALETVAVLEHHILYTELLERACGALRQRRDPLDGIDFFHERREYRGLVAAAGADLEHLAHLLAALEQRLGHAGHAVGLRDGLAV